MTEVKSVAWWNERLCDWFFPCRGPRPVYLRCDEAELELMNATFELGLEDPAAALMRTVGLYPRPRANSLWRRDAGADTPPPWLAYLAASVLVVERETDKGSTRFYQPLAEALGVREVRQTDYESTFFNWWIDLSWWLVTLNEGARGLPTWSAIPESPLPRSVIGHPYTQVFLRREDRDDLDEFLSALTDLEQGEFIVDDRPAAAEELLHQLEDWVKSGASVSGRLRSIINSNRKEDRATLGFILLGRLLDAVSPPVPTAQSPTLRIVPTFDEWNRRLHLSVVAPSWVSAERPLHLADLDIELDEAAQPIHLPFPPLADTLREGIIIDSGQYNLVLRRSGGAYLLAARDFSEWVSVVDPRPDEALYVLSSEDALEEQYRDWPRAAFCEHLPEGWVLLGPSILKGAQRSATGIDVPRLVGGLRLDNRQYLQGGEPRLELQRGETVVEVDGQPCAVAGAVELSTLGLAPGEHTLTVGPFRLSFWSIAANLLPAIDEPLCRLSNDEVALPGNEDAVCGAAKFPRAHEIPRVHLCPPDDEVVVLGEPGQATRTRTGMASWATDAGLGRFAFDPTERSSYPDLDRPMAYPWWIAGDADPSPWVMRVFTGLEGNTGVRDFQRWSEVVNTIGRSPRVVAAGPPADDASEVTAEWRAYLAEGSP